jgi:hypothetical protein
MAVQPIEVKYHAIGRSLDTLLRPIMQLVDSAGCPTSEGYFVIQIGPRRGAIAVGEEGAANLWILEAEYIKDELHENPTFVVYDGSLNLLGRGSVSAASLARAWPHRPPLEDLTDGSERFDDREP